MEEAANRLRGLIMGFRATQLVFVAARLGVADILENGPKTADDIAESAGASRKAVYRILRALATIGVVTEGADKLFALTAIGELLRSKAPGSLRDVALLYGDEWLWRAYGRTIHSAQSGEAAFDSVHGQTFYKFLNDNSDASAAFQNAMTAFSSQENRAILDAYDFGPFRTIVDIGAGHGALLTAIVRGYPNVSGVAFDAPEVIAEAERLFARAGLVSSLSGVGGDFFVEVPRSGDLYLLKSVLHNWDDAAAVRILGTCRRSMEDGTRLLVLERVIPPAGVPAEANLFDINMMVVVGGRERTLGEFELLFEQSGFRLLREIQTSSPLMLIEAAAK